MIAHSARGFGRQSPTPIIRVKSISNFDFIRLINLLMKETAIANQLAVLADNDRE